MQSILVFGRQPLLGLLEAESLFGVEKVTSLDGGCALVDIDPCNLPFNRLGGSIKLAKLLAKVDTTNWHAVEGFLMENAPKHSRDMPEGKMTLGLSAYNFTTPPKQILTTAIKIKKSIAQSGRNVRVVPNKEAALNSASVTHNKLTSPKGWEILVIKSGNQTVIAHTVMVQDILAYAKRDQARPYRDARVGMLPPKLAQIIINLASPILDISSGSEICEPAPLKYDSTVLDPFCGSGVILQEAMLMGFNVIGSDIDHRMVDYAKGNIDWLKKQYPLDRKVKVSIQATDATSAKWSNFDLVATEISLGKPLSAVPNSHELDEIVDKSNDLLTRFLENLASQAKPGCKLCVAIPAWQVSYDQFRHLDIIDRLEELGYNSVKFKHLNDAERLLYYRPNQIVARELLVITRK